MSETERKRFEEIQSRMQVGCAWKVSETFLGNKTEECSITLFSTACRGERETWTGRSWQEALDQCETWIKTLEETKCKPA